jgi:hypothetical protein
MYIYKLERLGQVLPDEVAGFVIVAPDELRARQRACTEDCDEGPGVWLDPDQSQCLAIGVSLTAAERIVLRDKYEA